jgi:hypothetical protein
MATWLSIFHRRSWCTAKMMAKGVLAESCDVTEKVLLPVKNVVHMMPFGKTTFATDWTDRLVTRDAEHERDKEIHHYEYEAKLREITFPTVRGSRIP